MFKMSKLRDLAWVAQAYVRGRVLKQEAYLPQPLLQIGEVLIVNVPSACDTESRADLLMRLWGSKPVRAVIVPPPAAQSPNRGFMSWEENDEARQATPKSALN